MDEIAEPIDMLNTVREQLAAHGYRFETYAEALEYARKSEYITRSEFIALRDAAAFADHYESQADPISAATPPQLHL